jgi:hypothetical protein
MRIAHAQTVGAHACRPELHPLLHVLDLLIKECLGTGGLGDQARDVAHAVGEHDCPDECHVDGEDALRVVDRKHVPVAHGADADYGPVQCHLCMCSCVRVCFCVDDDARKHLETCPSLEWPCRAAGVRVRVRVHVHACACVCVPATRPNHSQ